MKNYMYIYIYLRCPPGHHHNGFIATRSIKRIFVGSGNACQPFLDCTETVTSNDVEICSHLLKFSDL